MVTGTGLECVVCFSEFNPDSHIPRVLECQHTFCTPCLQRLSEMRQNHLAICCPLCRRVTCVSASLAVTCSLLIDIEVWNQITEARIHGEPPVDKPGETFVEWRSVASKSPDHWRDRVRRQLQKLLVFLKGY